MANYCVKCGVKLSLLDRLSGRNICPNCIQNVIRVREQIKSKYPIILNNIYRGKTSLEEGKKALLSLNTEAMLKQQEIHDFHAIAFRSYANEVLADDILTATEERQLLNTAKGLGIFDYQLVNEFKDVYIRLMIARVNDGRLDDIKSSNIIVKKDEKVHQEMQASLLKEVAIREYQSGYSGVSFRIAKGVRFHTGGSRGSMLTVGHELVTSDNGRLVVTSQRVIFLGEKTSIEMPYNKILSLDYLVDGVRFHLSNRKTAPLFRVLSGELVTAIVNAAMRKLLET